MNNFDLLLIHIHTIERGRLGIVRPWPKARGSLGIRSLVTRGGIMVVIHVCHGSN